MKALLLLLAYQAVWWISLLGAAAGMPWMGPCLALVVVACVLNCSEDFFADAVLMGAATLLGGMLDTLLMKTHFIAFPSCTLFGPGAPIWMAGLWASFGVTLRGLYGFMRGRPWLAALIGAIGGPLAYWGGVKLGALEVHGAMGYGAVSLEFALGLVILERLWAKVEGMGPRQLAEAEADALGEQSLAKQGAHS